MSSLNSNQAEITLFNLIYIYIYIYIRSFTNIKVVHTTAVAYRTEGGFKSPPPRNSEGPPKSCQTQPDCENCLKLLNLGRQHPKMFGKKAVIF